MRHTQITYPKILYHLSVTWEDSQRNSYSSPILVGNDETLSLENLKEVTHVWLRDRIEKRARRVLGFDLVQTVNL